MAKPSPAATSAEALRKENARLEAEVARLSKLVAVQPQIHKHTSHRWRPYAVAVSLILAVVLLVVGNLFFWTGNTLVKQDRFTAATAPIIQNAQVQQAMSLYATNQIFSTMNVQQSIQQVLPPRADFLAPQLAAQLKNVTQSTLQKALARPQLQTKWNTVLAKQHDRIFRYAETYQGNGTISLNDVFQQLTASLKDTKLAFLANKQLPPQAGNITVISAAWLPTLHTIINNIDLWRLLSVLGLIIFIALAVWLSPSKQRTIYLFCVCAALGLAVSLVVLRAARERIIEKVNPQYAAGVTQAMHILFHSLVIQTFTIIAALLIFGLMAWISGSSGSALATKRQVRAILTGRLHSLIFSDENSVSRWVGSHRRLLEWSTVVAFIVIMLSVRLTFTTLLVGTLLLLTAVLIIETMAARTHNLTDQS